MTRPRPDEPDMGPEEADGEVEGMLAQARSLVEAQAHSQYDLALLLERMVREEVPAQLGYSDGRAGFESFLEQRVGLQYRKARYLITIAETFRKSGVSKRQIDAIGWTKARALVGVDADKLAELVRFAATHTVDEVAAEARRAKGQAPNKVKRRSFAIFADQEELLDTALEVCRARSARREDGQLLELIVGEWLAHQSHKVPLKTALASLEATYGVVLSVAEPERGP